MRILAQWTYFNPKQEQPTRMIENRVSRNFKYMTCSSNVQFISELEKERERKKEGKRDEKRERMREKESTKERRK